MRTPDQEAMSVSRVKMLFVVAAVAVGLLLMLLVGLIMRPNDGKQPAGEPSLTSTGRAHAHSK